jgi:ribosomal protein L11 methyltransferase
MAFGSGYHPSTKCCLVLLQKLFVRHVPETVLDLGTGTGILSIASLKLGSRAAYAVDNNNLSIDVAAMNRRINEVVGQMHLVMGNGADFLHTRADLLVANIHYAVIDALTSHDAFYTKDYYLLSGLLAGEGNRIEEKLKQRLNLIDICSENFWFSYLFKNNF